MLAISAATGFGLVVPPRPGPAKGLARATTAHPPFGDPLGLLRARPAAGAAAGAAAALPLLLGGAAAAEAKDLLSSFDLGPQLDPATFQPVCPASDSVYRLGQQLAVATVGTENVKEYAPLIAGGLLRVRLELCVVESFLYEAIIPFIKERGLSWVLPIHETVETFLAGVVFAVATNFILIGSTKIFTVLLTYGDIILGFPCRLVGGAGWRGLQDRVPPPSNLVAEPEKPRDGWSFLAIFSPKPKVQPPTIEAVVRANKDEPTQAAQLAVWGALRTVGELSKGVRVAAETLDTFVGRYLLLTTVGYVGVKFVHFKLFDPFP